MVGESSPAVGARGVHRRISGHGPCAVVFSCATRPVWTFKPLGIKSREPGRWRVLIDVTTPIRADARTGSFAGSCRPTAGARDAASSTGGLRPQVRREIPAVSVSDGRCSSRFHGAYTGGRRCCGERAYSGVQIEVLAVDYAGPEIGGVTPSIVRSVLLVGPGGRGHRRRARQVVHAIDARAQAVWTLDTRLASMVAGRRSREGLRRIERRISRARRANGQKQWEFDAARVTSRRRLLGQRRDSRAGRTHILFRIGHGSRVRLQSLGETL